MGRRAVYAAVDEDGDDEEDDRGRERWE